MSLLKRVTKGGTIEVLFESSNIVAAKYDTQNKDLTVTFKNGGQYLYRGVGASDYWNLENAESQGVVLNKSIKEKYPDSVKLGDVDVAALITEIQAKGLSKDEKQLLLSMEAYITTHRESESLNLDDLGTVEYLIAKLKPQPVA
jgi:hypothetical protein